MLTSVLPAVLCPNRGLRHIMTGTCYMPYMGYSATDEAAVAMCAWFANAVDCITSWQDFAIIGPAGSELQHGYRNHINKIHKGTCDFNSTRVF